MIKKLKIAQDFLFLGSIMNQKGSCNQEICRLRLETTAMKEQDKTQHEMDRLNQGTTALFLQDVTTTGSSEGHLFIGFPYVRSNVWLSCVSEI